MQYSLRRLAYTALSSSGMINLKFVNFILWAAVEEVVGAAAGGNWLSSRMDILHACCKARFAFYYKQHSTLNRHKL